MKVLVAGDFCQKLRVFRAIKERKFGEIFDDVRPIIQSADYSVVNFEFPIVVNENDATPISKCGPNLHGTVEAVDALKYVGFNCCTLANNHILDQGNQSCLDTKIELEKAKIDTVGIGSDLESAGKILFKQINGETLAIINCCEHEFSIATDSEAGANPLNPIRQFYAIQEAKQRADYVLVIVHGGHEHFQLPSPSMVETYRFFVNSGADVVINHHQHCYSGYEIYKGKPIFYGIGNFLFDHTQKRYEKWNEGYMVMIEFKLNSISFDIHPYTQCCEYPCISLMSSNERDSFDKFIYNLNEIIDDDSELRLRFKQWIESTKIDYELAIQPYSNRILRALFVRGIIPDLTSGKKRRLLANYVMCESHVVRLINVLMK